MRGGMGWLRVGTLLLASALLACASEPTGTEDFLLDLRAPWEVALDLSAVDASLRCRIEGVRLEIEHPAGIRSLDGQTIGGSLTCDAEGASAERSLDPMEMDSGRQQPGGRVFFLLGPEHGPFMEFSGELGDFSMAGSVQGDLVVDLLAADTLAVTGSFQARRLSLTSG